MSSGYGQVDLAGFLKAPSFWFRSSWLAGVPPSDAGRPPLTAPAASAVVRIVELWAPPTKPGVANRSINVYTSAPLVALSLNGARLGAPLPAPSGIATWRGAQGVPYAPGALTATALAADGATVLATHTRRSWGAPAALVLSLDAPHPSTGTGRGALYQDGEDVALVRCTVVDAAGATVGDSTLNVTFAVASGPGLVVGCGNGDPANLDPNNAPWKPAYHGLARAIVRSTLDAATPDALRALRAAIDVDAGRGARASAIMPVGATPPGSLTVTASAPGLPTATLVVQLSVDPADSVLEAAAASVGLADLTAY